MPGAIAGADAGMAELLVRLALDLHGQELTALAAMFARLATRLAPDNSEAWMVAAELLAQQDRHRLAVGLLANVGADDPFAATAREQRIRLLVGGGDARGRARRGAGRDPRRRRRPRPTGCGSARSMASSAGRAEAADAFGRALAARGAGDDSQAEWTLWLMRGGALDQAGQLARGARRAAARPIGSRPSSRSCSTISATPSWSGARMSPRPSG